MNNVLLFIYNIFKLKTIFTNEIYLIAVLSSCVIFSRSIFFFSLFLRISKMSSLINVYSRVLSTILLIPGHLMLKLIRGHVIFNVVVLMLMGLKIPPGSMLRSGAHRQPAFLLLILQLLLLSILVHNLFHPPVN